MGRVRFELTIPWSLASEQEFARPKPGIIAKLDHRPMLDGQSSDFGYKNNGVSLDVIMNKVLTVSQKKYSEYDESTWSR